MLCRNPYMANCLAFGCGQCNPCRVNRRRIWTHRLLLEQAGHEFATFVTLTYAPEHLPENGTLVPDHLKLFLKRLRRVIEPRKIRYYAVGEYGDETFRPHYHAIIFGMSELEAQTIANAWDYGGIYAAECNEATCDYVAGYVLKKMTKADDERLEGRYPEFSRMSLKPGIGAGAMDSIANALETRSGSILLQKMGDVPNELQTGKSKRPVGRYLKKILRQRLGVPERGLEAPAVQQAKEEMRAMLGNYAGAPPAVQRMVLVSKTQQRVTAAEKKRKIFRSNKKGKTL